MTYALTVQREHLRKNRRVIIGGSVVASLVNAVPIPMLDDKLTYLIMRAVLRRVARDHDVGLNDDAARSLIFGKTEPPNPVTTAASTLAYRLLKGRGRRLLIAYATARQAQSASNYFMRSTLFDHYCTKLHVGLGLDGISALALRDVMGYAIDDTPGNLGSHVFRRSVVAAAKASARAPIELAHILSGGALRRLLTREQDGEEIEVIEELDMALEQQLRARSSFLSRTVTAVELQLSVEANPFLSDLIDNFERMWHDYRDRS